LTQFPFIRVDPGLQRVQIVELPLVLHVAQFWSQVVLIVETQPVLVTFIVNPVGQALQIKVLPFREQARQLVGQDVQVWVELLYIAPG
jgi:hypothetical protein